MTHEEIIEMARESGLETQDGFSESVFYFAKLVAEKEREACAKVADSHMDGTPEWNSAANNIAASIRARGEA
jgi:hypothetical protein